MKFPIYTVQLVSPRGLKELHKGSDLAEAQRYYDLAVRQLAPRTSVRILQIHADGGSILRDSAKEAA